MQGARARLIAIALIALAICTAVGFVLFTAGRGANVSPGGDLDARSLAIERQLLCPQCTNERLDICTLAICNDMKRLIRERLAAGDPPDDILLYFRGRYGDRVMRQIPREGFNLVLFGWVGGSLALVALAGGGFLYRLRRATVARASANGSGDPHDDAWLDAQLEREP